MKRYGYSLVELIIVLAVLAIVLSVGSVTLLGYQRTLTLRQGVVTVFADLTRARAQACKTSQDWQVVLTSNQNSYVIRRNGVADETINLPRGVRIGDVGGAPLVVQYNAPYGLRPQGSSSLVIPLQGTGRQGRINVVGISGKVVVVAQ